MLATPLGQEVGELRTRVARSTATTSNHADHVSQSFTAALRERSLRALGGGEANELRYGRPFYCSRAANAFIEFRVKSQASSYAGRSLDRAVPQTVPARIASSEA